MAELNSFTIKEGVSVSEQVMTIIAGLAATEVEGVSSLTGNLTNGVITRSTPAKLAKAIRITTDDEGKLGVRISLNMDYGYEIPKVCGMVQEKVKSTLENMTGAEVASVDVRIAKVSLED